MQAEAIAVPAHADTPATGDLGGLPLFSYYGLGCTLEQNISEVAKLTDSISRNTQLVMLMYFNIKTEKHARQTEFDFMKQDFEKNNVARLLPREHASRLNYGVYDTLRDLPAVRKAAIKLEECGYYTVRELISASETELRALPFMTDAIMEDIKENLSRKGLGLGTKILLKHQSAMHFPQASCFRNRAEVPEEPSRVVIALRSYSPTSS